MLVISGVRTELLAAVEGLLIPDTEVDQDPCFVARVGA